MNVTPRELDEVARPRGAALKFTYPSGSRPLEGYTIKRGVGRGGFGEVYFATSDAGKEVALKLIRRNLEVELRGVSQCLNLKHPNLIALYDIRTDEMGDQWVVMEYVSGESLEDAIDRHPSGMPVEEALWWMRGMCAGVGYLHDHGIVHRDLKPGNIFCDEGTVKIGDYGLAKFISCSRRSGQTESVGTVHYMAPEIANGRYGREIDTYALGIILFETLTGRVPFEGESVGEVLMKHLTAEPDLSALAEPYRDIVRRALAKDPGVRINSVQEMLALLPGGAEAAPACLPQPAARRNDPDRERRLHGVDAEIEQEARAAYEQIDREARQAQEDLDAEIRGRREGRAGDYWEDAREAIKSAAKLGDANRSARTSWDAIRAADRQAASVLRPAEGDPEEPIWKAIRTGWGYLRRRWHGDGVPPMSLFQKLLFAIALVVLVTWFADGDAFAVLIQAFVIYAIYYAVWITLLRPNLQRPAAKPAEPVRSPSELAAQPADQKTAAWPATEEVAVSATEQKIRADMRRRVRHSWRDRAQRELAAKPLREKLSELLGSMLLAAVFAAMAACIAPLILATQPESERWATFLWLATVGTLAAWAVLVPTKFAEGRLEDQVPMRVTQLAWGIAVGAAAWFVGDALMMRSPDWSDPVQIRESLISHELLQWPSPGEGNPPLPAYLAYFAFLFLVPRWWRQAEYTRTARLSVWTVVVCMGWAWLLHFFWHFPQPTGLLLAGVMATAIQLASPWMPPSRRRALAAEIEGGVA